MGIAHRPGRRFLVEGLDLDAPVLRLPPEVAHRVGHVMRMRVGDAIQLFDGTGGVIDGILAKLTPEVLIESDASRRVERPAGELRLAIPRLKSGNTELSLQKATELGATELIVYAAERSVPRESADGGGWHMERFERVVAEAMEQSGGAYLPIVAVAADTAAAAARLGPGFLAPSLAPGLPSMDEVLGAARPSVVAAVVGAEGGFSERELDQLQAAGGVPVGMGTRVLRSETAVIALAVLAARRFGWLGAGEGGGDG
ncbi:MAG: RsmE family RNA methyltransferase [Chloroflexota bacterium]|jgi:16S rRNA (uracil1498-N3)-methyltransferase|nr:RsmE family RNA methyltransferase [Chloroflexota bacterium]